MSLFNTESFPSPEQVLEKTAVEFRTVGLSNMKVCLHYIWIPTSYPEASYINDLATKFSNKTIDPESLLLMNDAEISDALINVKGIGKWTVDMFLIFQLKRPGMIRNTATHCCYNYVP